MGDNIYQRPLVRELSQHHTVFLETPWPELYDDIPNIHFVRGYRKLRTQLKNIALQNPKRFENMPRGTIVRPIHYNLNAGSIITDMLRSFGLMDFKPQLDMPAIPVPWPETPRPIALVRPVTLRTEWLNEARNPLPAYVYQIAAELMQTHFVILVADIASGETIVEPRPPFHGAYLHGELIFPRLLALIGSADIIVGGVGWIVPAAIAANKRAFIILGGQGGHNRPDKIIAPWWRHRIGFATPVNFCNCVNMRHKCPKIIADLSGDFQKFQATV